MPRESTKEDWHWFGYPIPLKALVWLSNPVESFNCTFQLTTVSWLDACAPLVEKRSSDRRRVFTNYEKIVREPETRY